MKVNKISISLKDNPDLAATLAGVSAGDTVCLEHVEIIVDEVTEDNVLGSIDEIKEAELKPATKDPEDGDEVDENAPVFQVMADKSKKY